MPADTRARHIELLLGRPDGLAVTALRKLMDAPSWPDTPLTGEGFPERFGSWRQHLLTTHPAEVIAESWAWLLADLGDLDTATTMLGELPGARLRHAEILYNRDRGDDRDRAAKVFRAAATGAPDAPTRLHSRLRLGDLARGRAARRSGRVGIVRDLAESYLRAVHVLIATRGGRRQPEEGGDAYRLLQQTSLRLLEQLAVVAPRAAWPIVALGCRFAAGFGGRAARLARNGNRLALVRQHRAMLRALAAALRDRPAGPDVRADMEALRATYRAADDLPGAANCAVTLGLLDRADGDEPGARALLSRALTEYAAGRPGGRPLPSGEALVGVMTRLLDRLGP